MTPLAAHAELLPPPSLEFTVTYNNESLNQKNVNLALLACRGAWSEITNNIDLTHLNIPDASGRCSWINEPADDDFCWTKPCLPKPLTSRGPYKLAIQYQPLSNQIFLDDLPFDDPDDRALTLRYQINLKPESLAEIIFKDRTSYEQYSQEASRNQPQIASQVQSRRFSAFAILLLATIVIESCLFLLFRGQLKLKRKTLFLIPIINLVSFPLFFFILLKSRINIYWSETIVTTLEGIMLYPSIAKYTRQAPLTKAILTSLILNAGSFLIGLLIYWLV